MIIIIKELSGFGLGRYIKTSKLSPTIVSTKVVILTNFLFLIKFNTVKLQCQLHCLETPVTR